MQLKVGGKSHRKLKTGERPIADKYREGKMKRTLKREGTVLEMVGEEVMGAAEGVWVSVRRGRTRAPGVLGCARVCGAAVGGGARVVWQRARTEGLRCVGEGVCGVIAWVSGVWDNAVLCGGRRACRTRPRWRYVRAPAGGAQHPPPPAPPPNPHAHPPATTRTPRLSRPPVPRSTHEIPPINPS